MRRWMRPAALTLALLAGAGTTGFTASPVSRAESAPPPAATLDPDLAARIDELAQAALTNGITGAVVGISDPVRGSRLLTRTITVPPASRTRTSRSARGRKLFTCTCSRHAMWGVVSSGVE